MRRFLLILRHSCGLRALGLGQAVLAAVFLLALSASVACSQPEANDKLSLWFETPDGKHSEQFSMEIADTDPERHRGLMYRHSIGAREGMIFIFPNETEHSFWMKNTYIPLDMVFVGSDWRVAGVLENVPPLTEESRSVGKPSKYVLEFAAGTMRSLGVTAGTIVKTDATVPRGQ